jgi:hypothetical protein
MLLLTSPNDQLQIVTTAAANISVHASWVDTNTSTGAVTPGRTNTAISSATTVSVAGAPAAGVQRNVKTLHIRNTHASLACTVVVQHTDGTIVAQLYKTTLLAGEMLQYTDQGGFARGDVAQQGFGGLFEFVSATQVRFRPFNGDRVKINGVTYAIPVAGVIANNTNTYLNGVAGQNLPANTGLLVWLQCVAGVLILNFRGMEGHVTSIKPGNVGVEVLTGPQEDHTLVGMVRTNASAQFVDSTTQRFVRSWFNRRSVVAETGGINNTYGGGTPIPISPLAEFMIFAGETVQATANGTMANQLADGITGFSIGIDNAQIGPGGGGASYIANAQVPWSCTWAGALVEGYHSMVVMGNVNTGIGSWNGAAYIRIG